MQSHGAPRSSCLRLRSPPSAVVCFHRRRGFVCVRRRLGFVCFYRRRLSSARRAPVTRSVLTQKRTGKRALTTMVVFRKRSDGAIDNIYFSVSSVEIVRER